MAWPELEDLQRWRRTPAVRQDEIAREVERFLDGDFQLAYLRAYPVARPVRVATYRQVATGILYNLVPGGSLSMGLSPRAEAALREILPHAGALPERPDPDRNEYSRWCDHVEPLREWLDSASGAGRCKPLQQVRIAPFLLARLPLQWCEAQSWLDPRRKNIGLRGNEFWDGHHAVYLEADELAPTLERCQARLPGEAEWEWAYRAGEDWLFPWGDAVPRGFDSEEGRTYPELQRILDDPDTNFEKSTTLGFVAMGSTTERCEGSWPGGEPRLRGGAVMLHPWQGTGEWMTLLCAYRRPWSEFWNRSTGIRLARSLK